MCSFVSDLEDRDKSCRGGACDKSLPDTKQSEINKLTQRSKLRPLKKNCRNSEDPSCARQDPRKLKTVTKPRKPFRKPFTAFSSQRGPFKRPRVTSTTRAPATLDRNKTEKDDDQTEKNMADKDDEEDRRPKQLKSNPTDNNYEKPDNNRKINNSNKDQKTRNNNINNNSRNKNRNKIYDENEEPTPEPEPSHHGNPRHHAFHSCKFVNPLVMIFGSDRSPRCRDVVCPCVWAIPQKNIENEF